AAQPPSLLGRCLNVLPRHRREIVGCHHGLDDDEASLAGRGRKCQAEFAHGGIVSSSGRSTTGRKICQPPLLTTITMGSSPWRGACEISGPVIWKAPSPHSTIGRVPVPSCAPSAPGTPNPIDA